VSVAVIIPARRGLAARCRDAPIIEREIEGAQRKDRRGIVKLSRMVRNDNSTLARVAQTGLQNLTWPKMGTLEAVQTKARYEVLRLESGLFILEIIVASRRC
jgi:biopolymer transport protein ExbB